MSRRSSRPIRALASCLLPAACCLLLAGCNAGKQMQQDLYARELRLQEDEIYRLEDCIQEYQAIVRSLRQENDKLKQSDGETIARPHAEKLDDDQSARGERSVLDNFDWSPNRPVQEPLPIEPPEKPAPANPLRDNDTPAVELPPIDLGEPAGSPSSNRSAPPESPTQNTLPPEPPPEIDVPSLPEATDSPQPEAEPIAPPPSDAPSSDVLPLDPAPSIDPMEEAPPFEPLPSNGASWEVETGGDELARYEPNEFNEPMASPVASPAERAVSHEPAVSYAPPTDGLGAIESIDIVVQRGPVEPTGEATLVALVQPIDEEGAVTLFQGEASVMLRDPSQEGPATKIARWDYVPSEVASAWRGMDSDPVLDFALVLPAETPADKTLELWVRLVDDAGEKTLGRIHVVLDEIDAPPLQTATPEKSPPRVRAVAAAPATPESTARGWTPRVMGETASSQPSQAAWKSSGEAPSRQGSTIRVATFEEAE